MASIIKVDTIQHSDGSAPTMAELGLDVSGSILQVKSSMLTAPRTVSTTWGFTKLTDLEVSITPKSTSSHFLLCARVSGGQGYFSTGYRLYRDDVNISDALGDTAGTRTRVAFGKTVHSGGTTNATYDIETLAMDYLDTNTASDTTTPIEFSIYAAPYSSTYPLTVNYAHDNGDNAARIRPISTFTVYEIAG